MRYSAPKRLCVVVVPANVIEADLPEGEGSAQNKDWAMVCHSAVVAALVDRPLNLGLYRAAADLASLATVSEPCSR